MDEIGKRISVAKRGKRTSPLTEFKKGHQAWNKGKKGVYSEEAIRKFREANLGKRHSPETIRKISEAKREQNKIPWWEKMGIPNPATRSDVRAKMSSKAKIRSGTLEWKERQLQVRKRIRFPTHHTKPEMNFETICTKNKLPFRYTGDGSFWIGNRNPDFVDVNGRKVAVEILGDYWHSPLLNPRIRQDAILSERQKIFNGYGWELIHFWESELKRLDAEEIVLNRLARASR